MVVELTYAETEMAVGADVVGRHLIYPQKRTNLSGSSDQDLRIRLRMPVSTTPGMPVPHEWWWYSYRMVTPT